MHNTLYHLLAALSLLIMQLVSATATYHRCAWSRTRKMINVITQIKWNRFQWAMQTFAPIIDVSNECRINSQSMQRNWIVNLARLGHQMIQWALGKTTASNGACNKSHHLYNITVDIFGVCRVLFGDATVRCKPSKFNYVRQPFNNLFHVAVHDDPFVGKSKCLQISQWNMLALHIHSHVR